MAPVFGFHDGPQQSRLPACLARSGRRRHGRGGRNRGERATTFLEGPGKGCLGARSFGEGNSIALRIDDRLHPLWECTAQVLDEEVIVNMCTNVPEAACELCRRLGPRHHMPLTPKYREIKRQEGTPACLLQVGRSGS